MPDDCNYVMEEEDKKMDIEKGKAAIFALRKAASAVRECNTVAECWIVKDLDLHIGELQNEIGGIEHDRSTGDR